MEKCTRVVLRTTERMTLFFLHKATRYKQRVYGRARPRAGQLTGGEFTPPERRSFLAGNCTLPCGQILSVDPTGLEFPRKGKEKREKKPQEADRSQRGSELLELNPKSVTVNTSAGLKTKGRVCGTDVDNAGKGVNNVLLFFFSKSTHNRHWRDFPSSLCNPPVSKWVGCSPERGFGAVSIWFWLFVLPHQDEVKNGDNHCLH